MGVMTMGWTVWCARCQSWDQVSGTKRRATEEFWVNLVAMGDWSLQGDANGTLNVNGKTVQVRNP